VRPGTFARASATSAQTVARRPRVRQGRRQVSEMKVGKDTPCPLNGGVREAKRQRLNVLVCWRQTGVETAEYSEIAIWPIGNSRSVPQLRQIA
jgi:hypothetical protein